MNDGAQMVTVRVGCDIHFECDSSATAILIVMPRADTQRPPRAESLDFGRASRAEKFFDADGNLAYRIALEAGLCEIRHDALVDAPIAADRIEDPGIILPVGALDSSLLRYLLPSRYCDSDRLFKFASDKFAGIAHPAERVQAIADWIHHNIEYRFGSGRPDISAAQIIERGYGVCRDFAHCMIALCRSINIPARYVTGHLPDIGHIDPGTPMDFHAYSEVYLGGQWHVYDARYNEPRIGRIKIAHGLDAVECAFATVFGPARLANFQVWAYQVNPREVAVGDPIDLSKRLDGAEEIRIA